MIKTILLGITVSVLVGVVIIFFRAIMSGMFAKEKYYGPSEETNVAMDASYDGKIIKLNIVNGSNEPCTIHKIQISQGDITEDIPYITADKTVKIGEGRIITFTPKTITVDKDTNIVIYYNDTQDVVGIKNIITNKK